MKQGWEIKKLGDVLLKISAGGDKPKLFSETITDICNIPVYANGTVNNGLCGYTNEAIIYDKCITISARGTIGFCCIRTEPFVPIVRLIVVVPKEEVSCEYLCYAVKNLKIINNGGTIPQLTVPMLKEYMIPVPERAEQERIVGELDCLSGIIAAKRAQLRELDTLAQSIFYTMFGDPITNDKGWQTKKLGEITEQINGLWVGKNPPFVTIAVIRNTNFTKDCNLDTNNIAYIQVEQKQYSTRKLKCGDIIIEKSGGSDKQPVGRPILFNIEDGEYSFSNFTSVLRVVDNTLISPKFLHKFLVYIYNQGYTLNMQSKTTGIRNLNFKLYKNMNVPIPPIALQNEFAEKIENIERQKELITKSIKETEDLFNSRMSYYFD